MDKFLDTYNLPKLNQEDTNSLNRLTISNETEALIKNNATWKSWGPMDSLRNSTRLQRKAHAMLHKWFHKIESEGTLPNPFYEASDTLDNDTTTKKKTINQWT
jgi:hypothetical protein